MTMKRKRRIVTFFKTFIFMLMMFILLDIIGALGKVLFNGGSFKLSAYRFLYYDLPMSFVFAIVTMLDSAYEAKAMRIDDISQAKEKTIRVLNKMRWRLTEDSEVRLVFTSIGSLVFESKVVVRFIEGDLQISGPRNVIEHFLRKAKFPYRSFEIDTFE